MRKAIPITYDEVLTWIIGMMVGITFTIFSLAFLPFELTSNPIIEAFTVWLGFIVMVVLLGSFMLVVKYWPSKQKLRFWPLEWVQPKKDKFTVLDMELTGVTTKGKETVLYFRKEAGVDTEIGFVTLEVGGKFSISVPEPVTKPKEAKRKLMNVFPPSAFPKKEE